MAQLTIYLPDEVEKKVRTDARRAKKSVSAYLADLATRGSGHRSDEARLKALNELFGSWEGRFPTIEDPPPDEPESL
ncbi:MAG: hypothetical protein JNM17_14780 [Archangium sp.]|nr:hypothetical protein [Archangium sp.]